MKILVINNETAHLPELEEMLVSHDLTLVSWEDLDSAKPEEYELLILTGSKHSVIGQRKEFAQEIEMVIGCKTPILGICFGFELIVHSFGGWISRLDEQIKGPVELNVIKDDPIFMGEKNFQVVAAHRWVVENLPFDLVSLAESEHGVEIIKHTDRLIYGFQFHPELGLDGEKLFTNLLQTLSK